MATQYAQDIVGNVRIQGRLDASTASINHNDLKSDTAIPRSYIEQESFEPYVVPVTELRVWDNFTALLPQTAATDDLAVIEGTFGTDTDTVQTSDSKNTSVTQRCRFKFALPPEYVSGESIRVTIRGGMITTVASSSATVDVECYAADGDGAVGSDLCTTAATSINSLTKADKDFDITPTGLAAGDELDIRVTIAITDSATATAVIGEISKITVKLDIKG
jgi:hypothetical protein